MCVQLKRMVLPLTRRQKRILTFKEFKDKSAFLKNKAQAFEAGDFLNLILRFWGVFEARFLTKTFLVEKKNV